MIGSPCHSGTQKRIEKESNKKLTNELAGLVGESFDEAAKPRTQEVPSVSPAASETGVFETRRCISNIESAIVPLVVRESTQR